MRNARALAGLVAFAVLEAAAQIHPGAAKHRLDLTRAARMVWGLDAPVATFAAQVHQESGWRADARSPVGAQGIAQFMPATAKWIGEVYPELAGADVWTPTWAFRAMVQYDLHLWRSIEARTPCDRMAMTLSAYNGGGGWVNRDKRRAAQLGLDPLRWWGSVETVNAGRAPHFWIENRGYPRRILGALEPRYVAWGPMSCKGGANVAS